MNLIKCLNDKIKEYFENYSVEMFGVTYQNEIDNKIVSYENDKKVVFDNAFQLMGYHRIISINNERNNDLGFGNESENTKVYNIKLFVYCIFSDEQVIDAFLNILQSFDVDIVVNSINTNKQEIYESELGDVSRKLDLSRSLIEIDYNISLDYQNNCLPICL